MRNNFSRYEHEFKKSLVSMYQNGKTQTMDIFGNLFYTKWPKLKMPQTRRIYFQIGIIK